MIEINDVMITPENVRPEMDAILLEAADKYALLHHTRLQMTTVQETATEEDTARLSRWGIYDQDTKRNRALGFLFVRLLELLEERDHDGYHVCIEQAAKSEQVHYLRKLQATGDLPPFVVLKQGETMTPEKRAELEQIGLAWLKKTGGKPS